MSSRHRITGQRALLATMIVAAALATISPRRASAQIGGAYDLSWNTLSSGGGASGGGIYALGGSIAQPGVGAQAGGTYRISSGFWAYAPAAPTLVDPPAGDVGSAPLAFRLHPGAPNPFTRATTIAFDLPHSAPARVDVYSVSGALVRTLLDGPIGAGRHTVTWRGDDDRGSDVSQGVYMMRLEAGRQVATTKVVLTR